MNMKCKICNNPTDYFGNAVILNKYDVCYYQCANCGFIQTEEPYWLNEAYSDAITKSDIGLIGRNISFAEATRNLILNCFDPNDNFLDYGGGYGIFVRLMRDKGFNFFRYDPHCKNLFAEGFDARPDDHYALVTAWEVFEHLQNPIDEIEKMLSFSHHVLFSTKTLPIQPQSLSDWWYYGLEHGQHIAFYSAKTLETIAQKFNLILLYSNGDIHLLGDRKIKPSLIQLSFNKRYRYIRRLLEKKEPPSLLASDYEKITGKKLR